MHPTETAHFLISWPHTEPSVVRVAGTFDQWKGSLLLDRTPTGFEALVPVQWSEKVKYKFIVDGTWMLHESQPTEVDPGGYVNNVWVAPSQPFSKPILTPAVVIEQVPSAPDLTPILSTPTVILKQVPTNLDPAPASTSTPIIKQGSEALDPAPVFTPPSIIEQVSEALDSESDKSLELPESIDIPKLIPSPEPAPSTLDSIIASVPPPLHGPIIPMTIVPVAPLKEKVPVISDIRSQVKVDAAETKEGEASTHVPYLPAGTRSPLARVFQSPALDPISAPTPTIPTPENQEGFLFKPQKVSVSKHPEGVSASRPTPEVTVPFPSTPPTVSATLPRTAVPTPSGESLTSRSEALSTPPPSTPTTPSRTRFLRDSDSTSSTSPASSKLTKGRRKRVSIFGKIKRVFSSHHEKLPEQVLSG